MTRRAIFHHGVLISLRQHMRRASLLGAIAVAVAVVSPPRADATILTSGNVSPTVGPGNTTISGPGNLGVGANGPGTLTVNGGSIISITFTNGGLFVGGSPGALTTGQGTVAIDGPGSRIDITGQGAFTNIGRWGSASTGSLTITNGGVLTGTFLSAGVGDLLGTAADDDGVNGSQGTVIVDGTGSAVTLTGFNSSGSPAGGTIGRDSGTGSVTLRNHATMSLAAPGATNSGPGFTVGRGRGTGTFNVESGATLTIDGTGVTGGTGPGITVGNNGTGTLNVNTGASVSITANQGGGGFTVGGGNIDNTTNTGVGTANFDSGATLVITGCASATCPGGAGFTLGWETGSRGTVNVLGGSTITMNGTTDGIGFTVGRAGAGTLTIAGSGTAVLLDGRTTTATPGNTIASLTGSQGTLNIQDGATFTINRRTANCCMTVGRLGTGALNIRGGGKLIINDSSAAGGGAVVFGGNSTSGTGGPFDATVSGPGSTLTIAGIDTLFVLGRASGGSGAMTIDNGATVNTNVFSAASVAGTTVTMTVSGGGTTMNLTANAGNVVRGAGFSVGAGGTGNLTVRAGAAIRIDSTASTIRSGFTIGGSRTGESGGTGTMTVDGSGTLIQATGSSIGFNVGYDNTCFGGPCNRPTNGTMTVSGGGRVLMGANAKASVGSTRGSTGRLTVTSGALLEAGVFLGVGTDQDGNAGGTGTLTVSNGGTVRATVIRCGPNGTINNEGGTLTGEVIIEPGCVASGVNVKPGTLVQTGANASVTVALQGGAQLSVAANTLVTLLPPVQPTGEDVEVNLIRGTLAHTVTSPVPSQPDRYRVQTPVATVRPTGTTFSTRYNEAAGLGDLLVTVQQGRVEVANRSNQITTLLDGQQASFSDAVPRVTPILPVNRGSVVAGTVSTFSWTSFAGAGGYLFEFTLSPSGFTAANPAAPQAGASSFLIPSGAFIETSGRVELPVLVPIGIVPPSTRVQWRVFPTNAAGQVLSGSTASDASTLAILGARVSPIAPVANTNLVGGTSATFAWSLFPGASGYLLEYTFGPAGFAEANPASPQFPQNTAPLTPGTYIQTSDAARLTILIPAGAVPSGTPVQWRIFPLNAAGQVLPGAVASDATALTLQ